MSTAKALWDARYLLVNIEAALSRATTGSAAWWRTAAVQSALIEASSELDDVVQYLSESQVSVALELMQRSEKWGEGAPVADLREDRDRIVALLGVIDFVLDQMGADEKAPESSWFASKEDKRRWKRVKNGRASIKKVGSAG